MATLASDFQTGYGPSVVRTTRDVEYDALSRVTGMLRKSAASGDRLAEIQAVRKNIELWTILAGDLSSEGNKLPKELRAQLLSLAAFSLRHSQAVFTKDANTEALIDVNMSIMKGLRSEATS